MRIPSQSSPSSETVESRLGQSASHTNETSADAPVADSHLPDAMQHTQRPAWASRENIGALSSPPLNLPGVPADIDVQGDNGANEALPAESLHGSVAADSVPAEPEALAQHLQELQDWVNSASHPGERQERVAVAGIFSDCWNNPAITTISVESQLFLSSLPPLPHHLINLHVLNCTHLTTLPSLSQCTELNTLVVMWNGQLTAITDLSAAQLRWLTVSGCRSVNALPSLAQLQNLQVLDTEETPLTSLPEDILSLPSTCRISLNASGLSDAVRNRLTHIMNGPGYAGPRIEYSMWLAPFADEAPPIETIEQAVAVWQAEAPPHLQLALSDFDWSALPAQDNVNAFSRFLVRMRETNDYRNATPELKAATQQRVAALLVQMQTDSALRENCFNLATDAVNTCGDRVALRMLDMENCAVISAAKTALAAGHYDHNPQALVDLCKGQHRLKMIEKEAQDKVATMHFTDPIEVHLGYLTKLTEPYRLPVRISTMLYPVCSGVTDADIAAVRKKCSNDDLSLEECEANDRAYQRALVGSDLMCGLLERLQPLDMQAVNTETDRLVKHEKVRLYEALGALDSTDPQYARNSRDLKTAFDAIEINIKVKTTLPVLQSFLKRHGLESTLGNA